VINTDKAPTYRAAMAALQEEGTCPPTTVHRQVKYLNNIVEADHGKLKRLLNPTLGFQSLRTAYATIKGSEDMRTFRKQQYIRAGSWSTLSEEKCAWFMKPSGSTPSNQAQITSLYLSWVIICHWAWVVSQPGWSPEH
jgi:hypothetical protein